MLGCSLSVTIPIIAYCNIIKSMNMWHILQYKFKSWNLDCMKNNNHMHSRKW